MDIVEELIVKYHLRVGNSGEILTTDKEELRTILNEYHTKQLAIDVVSVPKGTLNCPECGKYTQIVNHGKNMASCFYCGEKWAI